MQVLIDGTHRDVVGRYIAVRFGLKEVYLHSATKVPERAIYIGSISNRIEYKVMCARGFDPDHVIVVNHSSNINISERIGVLLAYYEGIVSTFINPNALMLTSHAIDAINGRV